MSLRTGKGVPHPPGATPTQSGVNFSVFSGNATAVELLLFPSDAAVEPSEIIELDPYLNKTFHFWHVFVEGITPGTHYAFRVDGPADGSSGNRFNRNKVLVDPYAMGNTRTLWQRADACGPQDNMSTSM